MRVAAQIRRREYKRTDGKETKMKRLVKACSCFLASMLLSCSIFCSLSVPVQAASVSGLGLSKLIDMVLTNQGIVANQTSLSSIGDVLVDTLDTAFTGYITYCTEKGLDWNEPESYRLWKENTNIVNALLDAIVKNRQNKGTTGTVTGNDVVDVVLPDSNTDRIKTITKDIQQPIVDAYKAWWEDCGGYYLVYIPSYKELSSYMYSTTTLSNLEYLTNKHSFVYVDVMGNYRANCGSYDFVDFNDSTDGFIVSSVSQWSIQFSKCLNWNTSYFNYKNHDINGTVYSYVQQGLMDDSTTFSSQSGSHNGTYDLTGSSSSSYSGLVSKEGEYVKLWKSLSAFKSYSIGMQDVYFSPTYTTVVNNDMTVTTDYITNNLNNYSYSQVQQEIDNSTDITEEIVNNIVTNNITNITNNYYYTTPDAGDDGTISGGDSSDDDLLNGGDYDGLFNGLLGNLLSLVTELIEFVVKFFVKGLELISGGFTAILNLLNSMTDSIGGLGELLGAFFPFVPQEFFDLMFAGMSVLVGIAIYRALRG